MILFPCRPVELRMEKVYMPCILQTKKRYVGWKYVSETQPPVLESKGIETIRRDQCGVMVKCLTNVFEILFKTYNISKVSKVTQRFNDKIVYSLG
jgi:DNA polymerase zeta